MPECDVRARWPMVPAESDWLIDRHVSAALAAAATQATRAAQIADFYDRLGARTMTNPWNPVESKIERHFLGVGSPFIAPVPQQATKYAGISWAPFEVLGPNMLVGGIPIGLDKIGHFFQQGYEFYQESVNSGATAAQLLALGKRKEAGLHGLSTTGIYSRADVEANLAGYRFYASLAAGPWPLTFSIRPHVTTAWDEESNPNVYRTPLVPLIWQNILAITAPTWSGTIGLFLDATGTFIPTPITFTWQRPNPSVFNGSRVIVGTYDYVNPTWGRQTGRISGIIGVPAGAAGLRSQDRVTLLCSWRRGRSTGRLLLTNAGNEHTLMGSWGNGPSHNDGGSLLLMAP